METELAGAMDSLQAIGATGLVMDVHTGELLAMVSLPTFNPNKINQADPQTFRNNVTQSVYELGSTFKPITIAGAMDDGVVTSLSKRSNCPGMRSGFVAGDPEILKKFLLYRTYHGSAMNLVVQQASIAAWSDEAHVVENRRAYKAKFDAVMPILSPVLETGWPDASFYVWGRVPDGDDVRFTLDLLTRRNVQVLPGSFLARDQADAQGRLRNPGQGFIRIALVEPLEACVEGASRIADLIRKGA